MKNKIIYNPLQTEAEKVRFDIAKVMVEDITKNTKLVEIFPAKNEQGKEGIYCETSVGGKKFWTYKELEFYFYRKNNDKERYRKYE